MKAYQTTTGKAWIAMRLMQNHIQLEIQQRHSGINVEQLLMLMELDFEDGLRPTEIAKRMMRSKGTVSSLLRHAEKNGFIASAADASNRNAKRIFITQEGKKVHDQLAPLVSAELNLCMDGFNEQEIAVVDKVMLHLIKRFNPEWNG
ncbi:MarR family transcriptional regulator [Motilimonas pumila]|uniref:MarR family transcriptional regulator n=1 Tax=Motilimonas pumila TaxID=2303987 RepID=A0A418YDC9_9GAMM|nr:MarR family transcriptional regulator [Motilimonas pumila]RJG42497.1 MarR family transcriptional regulator [Motilimonas pumila]